MTYSVPVERAGRIIREGGVVAYPTEGVFGFGCLPENAAAVFRILGIKQRDPTLGLVLIAAERWQLEQWIALPEDTELPSTADRPVTWVVPAQPGVPAWVRGAHEGVAVRITVHPVAAALSRATGAALVSTSANIAGRPPCRNPWVLRRQFHRLVDCIVPGSCGPAKGPSEIRDLTGNTVLRTAAP